MKAVPGELPSEERGWGYEFKWDGMRALAWIDGATVRLQSSNGKDVTVSFPELAGLAGATGGLAAVLDGEIVALDGGGRPNFSHLQSRMHVTDPRDVARRVDVQPAAFFVFDILALRSLPAVDLSYEHRRRLLADLVEPGPTWKVPAHHLGSGAELLAAAEARRMEGVMAKRLDSTYQPGRRSAAWRKIKVTLRQEFVVGGWAPGEGRRAGNLGALYLGYHEGGALRFAGRVGTGFDDVELLRLSALLADRRRLDCPFDPPPPAKDRRVGRWVEPDLVVEVRFAEWTPERLLRHPAYLGQRTDKAAADVTAQP
jgi:bifunctional non-homologous end joining protein LigD